LSPIAGPRAGGVHNDVAAGRYLASGRIGSVSARDRWESPGWSVCHALSRVRPRRVTPLLAVVRDTSRRTPVPGRDPRSPSPVAVLTFCVRLIAPLSLIDRINAIDSPTAVWISTVVGVWIQAVWWIFSHHRLPREVSQLTAERRAQ
jgi:hypothetical protein